MEEYRSHLEKKDISDAVKVPKEAMLKPGDVSNDVVDIMVPKNYRCSKIITAGQTLQK